MASPGDDDNEETQVLDIVDSPPPLDPIDAGVDHDQGTVPAGDTQVVDEDPDCAPGGSPVIDLWGETQVVDDCETGNDDDRGTERTEVLSDDEELSDDAATHCDRGERESDPGDGEEAVVDSDASTDEEGAVVRVQVSSASQLSGGSHDSHQSNHGSVKKSFAAVRAASLRSSGLAAAHNISPKMIDTSFSNGKSTRMDDSAEGVHNGSIAIGMEKWPNGTINLTSYDTRAGEVDLDYMIENSHRCTEDYHRDDTNGRTNNPRVKKLFTEVTPPCSKEPSRNTDAIVGKADPSYPLLSDYAIGGLSYVGSQEPGDLSQANALDVVNDFLLVNDIGSSQEFKSSKKDTVKSSPVFGSKGAQALARKADHRSPVGKGGIFDWIDSREDERGGDFFSKRKDAFFESRDSTRRSHSHPPKARHFSSQLTRGPFDKGGEKGGANPKTYLKQKSLTCSDSRLMLGNASGNDNLHNSETKTKKNLFKNMDESFNSKSLEQQLEATNIGDEEDNYDVGPDTQMAAEAMEGLLHGCPVNYKIDKDMHLVAGKVTGNSSKGAMKKKKKSLKNVSLRKRTSTPDKEGVSTRSKRRRINCAKSRRESPSISRKVTSNSRSRKTSDKTIVETNARMEVGKVEGHSNASSSVTGNRSFRSRKREKALGTVDANIIKDLDNGLSSVTLNVQLSVTKELIPGEYHVNTTPVAHRTRHSRAVNLLKKGEASSSEYGVDKSGLMEVRASGAIRRQDKLVLDVSVPVKAKRKVTNIVSNQTAKVENKPPSHTDTHDTGGLQGEEPKTGYKKRDSIGHPKRRRTSRSIPAETNISGYLNNQSVSNDGVLTTSVQPSTRPGKTKKFIKSVSEILTVIKQKKRSVSSRKASKSDSMLFGTGKLQISSVKTRSSVNSPSFKPFVAKDSTECSSRSLLHEAGSTSAANNSSTVVMKHNVDTERNSKLDGSPKGQVQLSESTYTPSRTKAAVAQDSLREPCNESFSRSSIQLHESTYTTPPKTTAEASPVCMAQHSLRTPCNKGSSRSSVLRELIRLEPTEASPTSSRDSRRRKDMGSVRVLFSHHLDEDTIKQQKKILARLGVPVASSMSDATHFVTDKFVRTRNMLEAMALGKPVVTHIWLESCGQTSCFLDEKNYLLRDVKKEKEIGFSMPVSLACACRCPLLQGRRVFITPNTKPGRELIASLVKAAHGQPLERIGRSATKDDKVPDDLLVISSEEDYAVCKPLLQKGTEIFSGELILNGIVIQKLEYKRHQLFLDHVKQTRSTLWLRREDGNQFHPVTRCP